MENLQTQITARAVADGGFRARLIGDPRTAITEEFGVNLPSDLDLQVHEDTATTAHLVLPPTGRLSEVDLVSAAGGSAPPITLPNGTEMNTPDNPPRTFC